MTIWRNKRVQSFVDCSKAIIGPFMEPIRLSVDNKLRQLEQLGQIVLNKHRLCFESRIHLVKDGHCLGYCEINPCEFYWTGEMLAFKEGYHLVEFGDKSLVYVFISSPLPTQIFIVFSINQLIVVLKNLPVDLAGCRQTYLFLFCRPQQLRPFVFMQDVDYHGFSAADYFVSIFKVRQLDFWVFFHHFNAINIVPLIFSLIDIFPLFIGD